MKIFKNESIEKICDTKLEKVKLRKAESLLKFNSIPREVIIINNDNEFNRLLKDFPNTIVVIDFWANWCTSCKSFASIFDRFQQDYSSDFIFAKINIDENPMIVQNFGITSIPTTLFMKGRQVLRKFGGLLNYNTLKLILENFKT